MSRAQRSVVASFMAIGLWGCAASPEGPAAPLASSEEPGLVNSVTQAAATSQTQKVTVVNTAADWVAPVPTLAQGTTNVAGTVGASQSGAWNVGVSGAVSAEQGGDWTVTAEQGSGPWNVSVSGTADVKVTNTPSVTLAGTPSVSVSSLPTVTIGNMPSVTIANTVTNPTNVRNTDERGRHPFQKTFNIQIRDFSTGDKQRYEVFATGKRLVVERITAKSYAPTGELVWLELVSLGSQDAHQFFPMTKLGSIYGTQDVWLTNQETFLYADNVLDIYAVRDQYGAAFDVTVSLSGYFIE